jgi:hypothetical protein
MAGLITKMGNQTMKSTFFLPLLLLLAANAPGATVADLGWLAGDWHNATGERWTEERWSAPRGGIILGTSRSGEGAQVREFEFLRVQAGEDGVPAYIAQPGGAAPVAFRLVQHDKTSATFENQAHDYPQRIRYERHGVTLTATISTLDGSNPVSWTLRRRKQ